MIFPYDEMLFIDLLNEKGYTFCNIRNDRAALNQSQTSANYREFFVLQKYLAEIHFSAFSPLKWAEAFRIRKLFV